MIDICMCVVNKQFELPEFVFNSVYVAQKYNDISLIAGCVYLCGVWTMKLCEQWKKQMDTTEELPVTRKCSLPYPFQHLHK